MKRRTTGSHLGRPTATVAIVGTQGVTGGQALSRLDRYEASLRNVLTTVEYRDFKVMEPKHETEQDPGPLIATAPAAVWPGSRLARRVV